jgi:hypothetical protein
MDLHSIGFCIPGFGPLHALLLPGFFDRDILRWALSCGRVWPFLGRCVLVDRRVLVVWLLVCA